jgi:hypothetical protein
MSGLLFLCSFISNALQRDRAAEPDTLRLACRYDESQAGLPWASLFLSLSLKPLTCKVGIGMTVSLVTVFSAQHNP